MDSLAGTDDTKWMTPLGVKKVIDGEIGSLKLFNKDPGPNWMLCDGRSLSKNEYPELFSKLGYRYGKKFLSNEEIEMGSGSLLANSSNGGVCNLFTYVDSNNYILVTSYAVVKLNGKSTNAYFAAYDAVTPMFYYKNYFYGIFASINSNKVTGLSVLRFSAASSSPTYYSISIPDTLYDVIKNGQNRPRYRGYYIISNVLHVIIGVNITSLLTFGLYDITFDGSKTTCTRILKDPTNFMSVEGFLLDGTYYDVDNMLCYNLVTKTVSAIPGVDQLVINELKANGYLKPGTLASYDYDLACSKDDSKIMFKFHSSYWVFLYRDNGILKYIPIKEFWIPGGTYSFLSRPTQVTNIESVDGVNFTDNYSDYSLISDNKLFYNYYLPEDVPLKSHNSSMGGLPPSGTIIYDESIYPFLVNTGTSSAPKYIMNILKYSNEYFRIPHELIMLNVTPANLLYIRVR